MNTLLMTASLLIGTTPTAMASVDLIGMGIVCQMVPAGQGASVNSENFELTFLPNSVLDNNVYVELHDADGSLLDDNIYTAQPAAVGQVALTEPMFDINVRLGGLGTERLDTLFASYSNPDFTTYLTSTSCDVL